jgi:hypothetical protein
VRTATVSPIAYFNLIFPIAPTELTGSLLWSVFRKLTKNQPQTHNGTKFFEFENHITTKAQRRIRATKAQRHEECLTGFKALRNACGILGF